MIKQKQLSNRQKYAPPSVIFDYSSETDQNGNRMTYKGDKQGRLTEIRSTYDAATEGVSGVSYEYPKKGSSTVPAEYYNANGKRWYAVAKNKLSFDPDDSAVMLTMIETGGLGRARWSAKSRGIL